MKAKLAILAIVAAVIIVGSVGMLDEAFAKQFQIVTSRGNVFTMDEPPQANHTLQIINNTQIVNNTQILNNTLQPFTLPMEIVVRDSLPGRVNYGNGIIGTDVEPQSQIPVPGGFEFASMVLDTDPSTAIPIPSVLAEYEMNPAGDNIIFIVETGGGDNILEPLSVNPVTYQNGWKLTPDGKWTVLENTPGESRRTSSTIDLPTNELITLKGNISSGMSVSIYSYVPGLNGGITSWSGSDVSSTDGTKKLAIIDDPDVAVGPRGHCGYNGQCSYWPSGDLYKKNFCTNFPSPRIGLGPNPITYHGDNRVATSAGCAYESHLPTTGNRAFDGDRYPGSFTYAQGAGGVYGAVIRVPDIYAYGCQSSVTVSVSSSYKQGTGTVSVPYAGSPTISCTTSGSYQKITQVRVPGFSIEIDQRDDHGTTGNDFTIYPKISASVRITNLAPSGTSTQHGIFAGESVNQPFTIPPYQGTLYMKTVGGDSQSTAQIKVFRGNDIPPALVISSMQANMPYQITSDGDVLVSGLTSSIGSIRLTPTDLGMTEIEFENIDATNTELTIWPDSMAQRGGQNSVMFDTHAGEVTDFRWTADIISIPYIMVKVTPDQSIQVEDVEITNTAEVDYDYLDGQYNAGDEFFVPVFLGSKQIIITADGKQASEYFKDIPPTSTRAQFATNEVVVEDSGPGDAGYVVARTSDYYPVFVSQDGNVEITLSSQVSGNGTFPLQYNRDWQIDQPGAPGTRECFLNDECGLWAEATNYIDVTSADYTGNEWVLTYFEHSMNDTIRAQGPITTYVNVYKNGEWVTGLDAGITYNSVEFDVTNDRLRGLVGSISYEGQAANTWIVPVEEGDFMEFVASTRVITVAPDAAGLSQWWGRSMVQNDYGYMEFIMP